VSCVSPAMDSYVTAMWNTTNSRAYVLASDSCDTSDNSDTGDT